MSDDKPKSDILNKSPMEVLQGGKKGRSDNLIIPKELQDEKIPTIEVLGRHFGARVCDLRPVLEQSADPRKAFLGIATEVRDCNNMLWIGMVKLYRDLAALFPQMKDHSEFRAYIDGLGLHLADAYGKPMEVFPELNRERKPIPRV